jgi:hypothetical protein
MLEKINNNFWFWAGLAFINLLSISILMNHDNKFALSFSMCMMVFCVAKAFRCATDGEK